MKPQTADLRGNWLDVSGGSAAKAVIDGSSVLVSCDQVTGPVAVRYAWGDFPPCNLYNKEGLPLVPGLIQAGMDCLQAMEVKAGMDMPRLAKQFGRKIAFCGNIDIRIVASNDRRKIDEELERKILPVLQMGSGFIVHSDHSIPPEVDHDTLHYFFDHGRRIVERMR